MVQAHLCVLPMRKQRFRTKAVPVLKGVFNETFQFIHMTKVVLLLLLIIITRMNSRQFLKYENFFYVRKHNRFGLYTAEIAKPSLVELFPGMSLGPR